MKKVLLVAALIVGLGFSGLSVLFSGSWEMDITFDPRVPITGLGTTLTIDYTISGWAFGSVSRLGGGTGWYRQDFLARGAIGAFELANHLKFDPAAQEFTFLWSTTEVSIAGVEFEGRLLIIPTGSGFRLGFSAPVEDLTFTATAYFGSLAFDPLKPWAVQTPTHTFDFKGLDVDITMPFYSTELTIDIDFTAGFEDITFTVPKFPLGIPGFALDLEVKYTLAAKTVAVTPHITLEEWIHFECAALAFITFGFTAT